MSPEKQANTSCVRQELMALLDWCLSSLQTTRFADVLVDQKVKRGLRDVNPKCHRQRLFPSSNCPPSNSQSQQHRRRRLHPRGLACPRWMRLNQTDPDQWVSVQIQNRVAAPLVNEYRSEV